MSQLASELTQLNEAEAARATDRAVALWRAALSAELPAGALSGVGWFAFARALPDAIWLELTDASIAQHVVFDIPDKIAERAVEYPDAPAALRILAAALRSRAKDPYRTSEVIRHAKAAFRETTQTGSDEHKALQLALVEAGELDAALRPT